MTINLLRARRCTGFAPSCLRNGDRARSQRNGYKPCRQWNGCSHDRPATVRFYFQLSVQLVQSLAHAGQTDARFRRDSMEQAQAFFGYAFPEIAHLQNHGIYLVLKANGGIQSSGVAMDIGKALLQYTE